MFTTELNDVLQRHSGSTDRSSLFLTRCLQVSNCQVDLGLERDRGKRFALWAPLYMLGSAPDLEAAFEEAEDRDAARNFMGLLAASEGEGRSG